MISCEKAVEIAELYYDDVYRLCLSRLRREEDAHDVTQDVFLFLQEHRDGLSDDNIKAWLYSVADNKIKEQFRSIARREKEIIWGYASGLEYNTELSYETEEGNNISAEEIEEKKKAILSSLTEAELKLFEKVYVKHAEYSELAKAMNISEEALRSRIYRLKLKIKKRATFIFMAILLLLMRI